MKPCLFVLTLLATGGCAPFDAHVGDVQSWNIAQQVVDPDPRYGDGSREGDSGIRAAAAVGRLDGGTVKQPTSAATNVRTGGASASSQSGGTPN